MRDWRACSGPAAGEQAQRGGGRGAVRACERAPGLGGRAAGRPPELARRLVRAGGDQARDQARAAQAARAARQVQDVQAALGGSGVRE